MLSDLIASVTNVDLVQANANALKNANFIIAALTPTTISGIKDLFQGVTA